MENLEKFPTPQEGLPLWEREFRYKSGEIPLEYNHTFQSGENLRAFQDEKGIAHVVLERNGKTIFNADDLVPRDYVLAAPLYVEQELEKQGKEVPLFGTGEWITDHTHKLINVGEFHQPQDIISLLHEIGHARIDDPKLLSKMREIQALWEGRPRNDKDYEVLLYEEEAQLMSVLERNAWAYALNVLRNLRNKGFDFHVIFPNFEDIKQEISQSLKSYREGYSGYILKSDPSFYKDLQKLFDKPLVKR